MTGTAPIRRRLLTAASAASAFAYGIVVALIGVMLNSLATRVQVTLAEVGEFFFWLNIGVVLMLFATGALIDRFGKKPFLVLGSLVTGGCMLAIAHGTDYTTLCVWFFVMGLGAAGLTGGTNILIIDLYPDNPSRALNLVNTFFGLGAVFLPFAAGLSLAALGLTTLLTIAAVLCLVPGALFLMSGFPRPTMGQAFRLGEARGTVTDTLVVLLSLALFFYVSLEVSTGGWSRPYLEERHGIETSTAQLMLAGYWLALVIGRVIAGWLVGTIITGPRLLLFASAGACIGLLTFILAPTWWLALVGLYAAGLCYAPYFPTTLGTVSHSFPKYSGTIIGIVFAFGVLGAVVVAPAIGPLWERFGAQMGIGLIFAMAVLMLITQAVILKLVPAYPKKQAGEGSAA